MTVKKYPSDRLNYAGGPQGGQTKKSIADHAKRKILAVRLMGMLHDLTHAPFGHTLEDEIELVDNKHDEPGRQADAFYRLILQYFGWIERNDDESAWGANTRDRPADGEHEALLVWYLDSPELHEPPNSDEFIDFLAERWVKFLRPRTTDRKRLRRVTSGKLSRFLKDLAFAMRALVHLDIAHKDAAKVKPRDIPDPEYPVDKLLNTLLSLAKQPIAQNDRFQSHRDAFLLDVIGNTICADLLDYARRDAVNAGLRLDYDPQRIVDNMTVVSSMGKSADKVKSKNGLVDFAFSDACLRTCVSLFSHKLRTDVPGELLNLLQVRYFVYERMLYHPTKCVAGAILGAGIQFIGWKRLPQHWRFIGDQVFLHQVSESARLVRDLLFQQPKHEKITSQIVTQVQSTIRTLPIAGCNLAAIQLLEDRLVTVDDVVSKLEVVRRLRGYREISDLLLPVLKTITGPLDDASLVRIAKLLTNAEGPSETATAAMQWLENAIPTSDSVLAEIKAGLRLIDRLTARRYLKITFRLLPNAQVPGLYGEDAAKTAIAELFKKPLERKIAEREIERRAELPPGSVVIHCPPVKGPAKIAKILISSMDTTSKTNPPRIAMLNSIETIDPQVYSKHQQAIRALEEMYASTWRFAVSIAPPHDANWEKINGYIGEVLFELLTGSQSGEIIKNDDYTVCEIQGLEAAVIEAESREASESDEIEEAVPASAIEQKHNNRLADSLRKHPEFSKLSIGATDVEITTAFFEFQKRIQALPAPGLRKRRRTVGANKAIRGKDDVRLMLGKLVSFDRMEKASSDRMNKIISRASCLDEDAWSSFSKDMLQYRSRRPLDLNSVGVQQREVLFNQLEQGLDLAESPDAIDGSSASE